MYDVKLKDIISEALCTPTDNAPYLVGRALTELYPDRYVLFGRDYEFDIAGFARHGHCYMVTEAGLFNQFRTEWWRPGASPTTHPENGLFNVFWEGRVLDVLYISWREGWYTRRHHWIVAETQTDAEGFLSAVCEFSCEAKGEVLVFEDGCWSKDKQLFNSIKATTMDRIVLKGNMKAEILIDLVRFFDSRETYEQYGVPWKRGVILIGPPGNGKTGMVKALVNDLSKPCLYVKSFDCKGSTPQENIRDVFERARRAAPCVMVLEDIDSLIKDKSRSFFLNEMDGFAANSGLAVLATTNHPERLDPAILDRPSRFDRKFYFELPGNRERAEYLGMWNDRLAPEMQMSCNGLQAAAHETKGFSYAFLKELCMSSVTEWLSHNGSRAMDRVVCERAVALSKEVRRKSAKDDKKKNA